MYHLRRRTVFCQMEKEASYLDWFGGGMNYEHIHSLTFALC